ncbi:YfhO family protein [Candidatus Poribacteria bacterium]|nr:YfhO family protein [Candidatus Poribacteria bacterium]
MPTSGQKRIPSVGADVFSIALFLFATAVFWKLFVLGRLVIPGPNSLSADMYAQFYPKFVYGNVVLESGHFPLWNPYEYCGVPFLATLHNEPCYPFKLLIFWVFPPHLAIQVFIAFHIFLAAVFTYLFFRAIQLSRSASFLGALIWAFSESLAFLSIYHPHRFAAAAWLPFCLMSLHKLLKGEGILWSVLLAIGVAMEFLAGMPQMAISAFVFLVFYDIVFTVLSLASRERLNRKNLYKAHLLLVFSAILCVCLVAVQFLPFLELMSFSQRASGIEVLKQLTPDYLNPPSQLFLGSIAKDQTMRSPFFMGITSFILLLYAVFQSKRETKWFFIVAGLFTTAMSLGSSTPLHGLLHNFPPFKYDRFPMTWVYLYSFPIAGLAAIGLDYLKNDCAFRESLMPGRAFHLWRRDVLAPVILVGFAIIFAFSGGDGFETMVMGIVCILVALLILSRRQLVKEAITVLLIVAGLTIYSKQIAMWGDYIQLPKSGIEQLSAPTARPGINSFLENDKLSRVYSVIISLNGESLFSRVCLANGYEESLLLRRMQRIMQFYNWTPTERHAENWEKFVDNPNFINLMGTRLIYVPAYAIPFFRSHPERYAFLDGDRGYAALVNRQALPKCFLVNKSITIKDEDEIFDKIVNNEMMPSQEVLLEEDARETGPLAEPDAQEDIPEIVKYLPEEVVIKASPKAAAFLVLGDSHYPGWKAYDNDKETHIYQANYLFRAVYLPPGEHLVRFSYEPATFRWGLRISLAAWLFVAACLVRNFALFWRRKPEAQPLRQT